MAHCDSSRCRRCRFRDLTYGYWIIDIHIDEVRFNLGQKARTISIATVDDLASPQRRFKPLLPWRNQSRATPFHALWGLLPGVSWTRNPGKRWVLQGIDGIGHGRDWGRLAEKTGNGNRSECPVAKDRVSVAPASPVFACFHGFLRRWSK